MGMDKIDYALCLLAAAIVVFCFAVMGEDKMDPPMSTEAYVEIWRNRWLSETETEND